MFYIAYRILLGLSYLNDKKILHRDLKPSNILLSSQGDIKIADFGESGNFHRTFSYKRTLVGSLLYNSPERIRGENYYLNCDVWSLGIILLEGALGRNPMLKKQENRKNLNFMEIVNRVQEIIPEVPSEYSKEFKELIELCLTIDPLKRPGAK